MPVAAPHVQPVTLVHSAANSVSLIPVTNVSVYIEQLLRLHVFEAEL